MSVIAFTTREIVDIIAAHWSHGSAGSSDALRRLEYLAEFGNKLFAANAMAYQATYGEICEPEFMIEGRHIKSALISMTGDRKMRGNRNLRSLRYNLIANNGQDFADAEILDGLLGLYDSALTLNELRSGVRS